MRAVCCQVGSLWRADQSYRGILLSVVRRVWSRNVNNEGALAHWGLSHQKQTSQVRLIFCSPCIIMYHSNVTNLIHVHFHKHFIVSYSSFGSWWHVDAQLRGSRRMEGVTQLLRGRWPTLLQTIKPSFQHHSFHFPCRDFQTVVNVFATDSSRPHERMLSQSLRWADWPVTPTDSNGLVL
jgi:hypothetical protein